MADIYSLTIRADTSDVTRARQALDGLSSGAIKATRTNERLANTANRNVRPAFRAMKGATTQLGFQLQDIAVQAGMGVNAFQILGQQGSQVASIFGPGGALLGAVLAIGGAIGGAFVRSMGEGAKQAENLSERIQGLETSFDDLTQAQIRGLRVQFFAQNRERQQAIEDEQERIASLRREVDQLRRSESEAEEIALFSGGNSARLTAVQEELSQVREELALAEASLDTFYNEADRDAEQLDELINGTSDAGEEAEKAADKLQKLVSGLEAQAEALGKNARETALYEAARLGANEADLQAIKNSFDLIKSHRRQQQAQKALIESTKISVEDDPLLQRIEAQKRGEKIITEEAKKAEDERAQLLADQQANTLSNSSQFFENLANIAEAGGKDQFQTYKNLASAQAAISAAQAISSTLGDPTIPTLLRVPLAFSIGALAAAQVAQIQSQTYQGARAMGGQVQAGSSYLVGERGPEVVTMGATGYVTPNHRMGAEKEREGVTVNVNNAPPGTRTETRRDGQGREVVDVFVADMASGGPMSKTMQSTFGLRRQGR